jgi:hypothetical protein
VTGSGRSGTSTVAGTLKRLGLHVPQPEKPADEANPRGFYETQWVNDFHKSILDRIPVRTGDSRPRASELAATAVAENPEYADRLREWLAGQLDHPQLLIKDPRAFWVHDLWRSVAEELQVELVFLTMVRHPVEVAKSRDAAFLGHRTAEFRQLRETSNVAGWCNVSFESERATRASRRCFLRYSDLVSDWRSATQHVATQLGLQLQADPASPDAQEIDRFVDPTLYRSQVDEDWDVPPDLRASAERVWELMKLLVDDPQDDKAIEELTSMRSAYARMHDYAVAIALDDITAQEAETRKRVRRRLGKQHRRELKRLRAKKNRAIRRAAAARSQPEESQAEE